MMHASWGWAQRQEAQHSKSYMVGFHQRQNPVSDYRGLSAVQAASSGKCRQENVKTDRLGLTRRDRLAVDAAKLYHEGRSQAEVAEILHVSRPNVSKLLTHARQRGFVRVSVEDPREKDTELINYLKAAFDLVEVRLVSPAGPRETYLRKALGKAGAALLKGLIRDGDTVGFAWSPTMGHVASQLGETTFRDIAVVQLCGNIGDPSLDLSGMQSFEQLRGALGASVHLLGHPSIFESVAAKQAVEREHAVREVLNRAVEARIAVYTVGSTQPSSPHLASPMCTSEERDRLMAVAVGDICSHFVDGQARVCLPDLNARTLAISLPDLRHKEQKVLVASGAENLPAIHAALNNGYANRLVIDVATARRLYAVQRKGQQSHQNGTYVPK